MAKRKTRAELEAYNTELLAHCQTQRGELDAARKAGVDLREKLDAVKEQLAYARSENDRMRGYLDRVMEDDHVREELITVGETEGEQHLVPKRKHRQQPTHVYHENAASPDNSLYFAGGRNAEKQRQRRHWVTY